jgi:Xaa-Pro aminopeptidase
MRLNNGVPVDHRMHSDVRGEKLAGLSAAVRSHRLERMQDLMRAKQYDALAFTGADWFEWASNHAMSSQAFERPFLLVVTADGRSLAVMSELGRNAADIAARRGSLWMHEVHYYSESPAAAALGWIATQWPAMVADAVSSFGLAGSKVGVDSISEPLARAAILSGVRFEPGGADLRGVRCVKHSDELQTMRHCAALSDWAIDAYRQELRPGRLLAEVDYLVCARLVVEAARRHPGEDFGIARLVTLSGAASACPNGDGAPNGKVLEPDSIANSTIATRLNGLAMELSRPWLVGRPGEQALNLFDCARSAQQAAIDAAIAGQPVSGIHAAAQKQLDHAGYGEYLRIRAGHGIGVVQHDFPVDVPFNDRPLLERETYAIEPGLFIPGIGAFRFADTIAIGVDAPEHLTNASKERTAQTLK